MIRIPNFLRELIESEAYGNKQHPKHQDTNEKVSHYMKFFYPGEMYQDATGKFVPPQYNMTLDQFNAAQNQYDALVSFVFNIGPGSSAPQNRDRGLYQSTIRRYLNNEEGYTNPRYPTREHAWRAFRNNGLLDRRRDAEWRLFENADYSGYR